MVRAKRQRWAAAFMAATMTLVSAAAASTQEVRTLAGPEVAIYNLAGRVEVVAGSGEEVVVRVNRGGRDAGRLTLETGMVDGRQSLRVVYPGNEVVYPPLGGGSRTSLSVAPDGTFSDGRSNGREQITIRGTGNGLEAWADVVVEVPPGRHVRSYLAVGSVEAAGVRGDLTIDTGSGRVAARDIVGALSVDTGSGAVEVEGVQGGLLVGTGSGSITVRGVEGGDVELNTGSGSVDVRDVTARELIVDTGSGRIAVAGARAPIVHLDTGSGSIEVEVVDDVEELLIDTGSGRVTATVPTSVGAQIHVETGSGRIEVDLPMEVRTLSRSELRGRIGDGRGRIEIGTGSGSITVTPAP